MREHTILTRENAVRALAALFGLALVLLARGAHAQSIIKHPGDHPNYAVELEPHAVAQYDRSVDAHTLIVAALFDVNPVVHTLGFGELDPRAFTVLISASREYPSTAGARLGGVAGRAFTTHRMTVIASSTAILAFQQGRILGWAEYRDDVWAGISDLDFRHLHQVHPVTGDVTYPAEDLISAPPR